MIEPSPFASRMEREQRSMYSPHSDFTPPTTEDIAIWRYVSLSKFVSMLKDNALYFTRIDCFGDHYEGTYAAGNLSSVDEMVTEEGRPHVRQMLRSWSSMVRATGQANCWHMNEHESDAMWFRYSNEGIAIRSTYARLRDSFGHEEKPLVHIGTVRYIDYGVDMIGSDNVLALAMHKRMSFAHERELRAFIWSLEGVGFNRDGSFVVETPLGVLVPVDLSALIDRVYVAPRSGEWFKDVVSEVMSRMGYPSIEVKRSSLDDPDLM